MRVKRRCIFNALRPLKLCHLALENVSLSFFKRFPLNDYAINFYLLLCFLAFAMSIGINRNWLMLNVSFNIYLITFIFKYLGHFLDLKSN